MSEPIALVEVNPFLRQASAFMSNQELEELKWYLANNPTAGVLIQDTGGIRKLRWAAKGHGKRGGARVIYFFHNDRMPIWLLAAYPKNAKSDLSSSEKKTIKKLTEILVEQYTPGNQS